MYNRWNGRNTKGGCTLDGTAEIRREVYNRWIGRNTEGGCTIDGTAEIWREDVQLMERQKYGGRMYTR